MLNTAPSFAPGTWKSPAVPVSCIAAIACIDTPVAPTGWPFAFSPPEGFTGSSPPIPTRPSRIARAPCPSGASPIAS